MQVRWSRRTRWTGTMLRSLWRPQPAITSSPCGFCLRRWALAVRSQATAAAATAEAALPDIDGFRDGPAVPDLPDRHLWSLPSPPPERARDSAKLAALHARLALPPKLPLETLARTLVDASADPNPHFNNVALAQLGNNLMAYHGTEHIICHYPRIPTLVLFAALYAYTGPKALPHLVNEWGVEVAAEPGGEVDPGLLQLKRLPSGAYIEPDPNSTTATFSSSTSTNRPNATRNWRRSISSRIVYDDEFGEPSRGPTSWSSHRSSDGPKSTSQGSTLERAQTSFARAVLGAVYMHGGRAAAKAFFADHVLSRHLSMSALFNFREPTRDLSRLCAREGFEGPVARLISETGRHSRHPVFVVGVYSGDDKLGEAAGSSLDEARTKASVAALKSWYLYSPLKVHLPSDTEEGGQKARDFKSAMIDGGEVIV